MLGWEFESRKRCIWLMEWELVVSHRLAQISWNRLGKRSVSFRVALAWFGEVSHLTRIPNSLNCNKYFSRLAGKIETSHGKTPLHDATQPWVCLWMWEFLPTPFPFRRSGFSQAVGSAKWWLPFGLFLVQQGEGGTTHQQLVVPCKMPGFFQMRAALTCQK